MKLCCISGQLFPQVSMRILIRMKKGSGFLRIHGPEWCDVDMGSFLKNSFLVWTLATIILLVIYDLISSDTT